MNAYKFIETYGLTEAQKHISTDMHPFSLDKITLSDHTVILADTLKQAISDYQLINEFGGLNNCKDIALEMEDYIPPTYKLCIMLSALKRIEEGLSV